MEPGWWESRLRDRFPDACVSPGGEVWVQFRDALAALDLATGLGLQVLGMEGFIVGRIGVFPSMSRIADFSDRPADGAESARQLLAGTWSEPPNDVHSDAQGDYMIDIVVAE